MCGLDVVPASAGRAVGAGCLMSADLFVAFDDWLNQHGSRLAIPAQIIERNLDMIRLRFTGIADVIEIIVVRHEISVVVNHRGQTWDTLAWFDCAPRTASRGVFCCMCLGEDRAIFPHHQALFADHLFQPFAEWVVTKLPPAAELGLGGQADDSTWATLLPANNRRGYSVVIPLHPPAAAA
jgi:hypothetical protein